MQGELLAAVAGIIGLVLGVVVGAVVSSVIRANGRSGPGRGNRQTAEQRRDGTTLPPGIAEVLAALPSSAVVLDSADRVLRASSAARAFGIVRGEELVISELLALARQVRRDGVIRETDIEVAVRKFGPDATSFAVRVAPLGGTGLVLVLAEDQTEHRRLEAVRRDFVANISHELKTPVGALSLLAETVQDASDDPEAVRRFTERMQTEANRLTAVIQDLITLSRIQGAEPMAEPAPVDLNAIVEEALDTVRMPADAKGIDLVGSGAEGITVMGDESLLGTALRNLVSNAVAYSPKNTRVAVSVGRSSSSVDISVADQGIGIPQQDLERIFERFYRVDAARSRATGGTGLGLAIVKHIMTHHRGEVTVWSKEGSGSTFTLRLPRPEAGGYGTRRNTDRQEAAL
ncbi:two-component sensor histidine kinase [Nocardiopsis kunsanensis]|uniref:Sensor-like histidine kinase SenX3 n=1 Tax=Nocardiopsis kunsanensis TaxID=141693 RepID=A0A918XFF4_9ACTN|nr:ATP-binding protein [Nocardiopsis kunsanensis]GHD29340.1 two-component sensor histidine kinase [Nocardiopsis kunsanensis]